MIGAVSAANNDAVANSDVNDDTSTDTVLAQTDVKTVSSNNDEPILKENYSETSFKALNKTINEATGLEIELDKDFIYDESSDSEFKDGIIINKSLTIDGNGKTINAVGKAGIFKITSGAAVTIKNLNFINGNANKGGAIYVDDNCNLTITDSNLTNNKAVEEGGAIYNNKEGTVIVDNAIFTNNYADKRGGAIQNYGQLTVSNSLFEKNSARLDGGTIRNYKQLTVIKSTFRGNKADTQGAAVSNWYGIINITECVFENNEVEGRGGAVYSNTAFEHDPQNINHVSYSNFTNNTARDTMYSGGAIYFTNNLNATGNIFTNNHADGKETIFIMDDENVIFENNTYISTDMHITGLTLNIKDNRTTFNATEDIILIYDIALKYPENYKDIKTGLRDITLYVDGENRTTLYEDITLSNLKPGHHTAYFTVLDQVSNNITFYVFGKTEISTPETTYEYAEGANTKIPLVIIDKSELTGTINITVKDQDSYKLISTYYNVRNGSEISTATLAEALKNIYGTLDSSYTINITYSSEYGYPSSTEFILNVDNERNTDIIYDIINNTEGNL
ncbi:MAG: hypothetical protein J6P12_10255, partial [Methanobrevibacter sp.]|nr:hypothetical protein [Methanobrevibacter sp.]